MQKLKIKNKNCGVRMTGKFFGLKEKQTNIRTEFVAGATTFLTMAYIIFVNPNILSAAGMDKQALIIVTCIVSAIITIITGLFANAPIAMAPGMGLNAFLSYSLVMGGKITWQTALGVVFLSGLLCFVLTLLGLRKRLVEAIPISLISAISVGIGLFITFIGLVNMGIIVKNESTLVSAGPLTWPIVIGLCGLLVMAFLEIKKVKGSLLLGIMFATALAVISGYVEKPKELLSFSFDIRSVAFQLDILGAFKWGLFGSIFTLMFMDMFDSIGTLVACCNEAKMIDEKGKIKGLDLLLQIDAAASMLGAALGTSTITSYIESAAGIEEGGRTGLTSVVTGVLFLLALLFVPIVGIVPAYATGPALVMVGLFMMKEIKRIDFGNLEEAFPAFIIMVMIALSYSISTGLAFGFISFVVIKTFSGKIRDVKPTMWVIAALSVMFLSLDHLPAVIEYLKQHLVFGVHTTKL
jgi:AGZA family xanthine/uracil permease-like MFS transporter